MKNPDDFTPLNPEHSSEKAFSQSTKPTNLDPRGNRVKLYPSEINGRWMKKRRMIAAFLMLLFFTVPWIQLKEGVPFIRLHFTKGFFFLFGNPILIYEIIHFGLLLLLLLLVLFLVSTVTGRLWCGLACPQTIFVEHLLRPIETMILGNAAHRKVMDSKSPSSKWKFKTFLFHTVTLVVCLSFGYTVVAYFQDPLDIFSSSVGMGFVIGLAALAALDALYLREQFCVVLCPYARFQSVFQDSKSRNMGYDRIRGEPRSKKKSAEAGDCIDCGLCTRVCPTGIDIRQGPNQLECINCFRCADACDVVMRSLGKPSGLVRQDSEEALHQGKKSSVSDFYRPRVLIYLSLVLVVGVFGVYEFLARKPFKAQLLPLSGNSLFELPNGEMRQMLNLKVSNQSPFSRDFQVALNQEYGGVWLDGTPEFRSLAPGHEKTLPIVIRYAKVDSGIPLKPIQIKVASQSDAVMVEHRIRN